MQHGILKVSAVSPKTVLGAPERNAVTVIRELCAAKARGVELLVFPELFLTGATAGDLFFHRELFERAAKAAEAIRRATAPTGTVNIVRCAERLSAENSPSASLGSDAENAPSASYGSDAENAPSPSRGSDAENAPSASLGSDAENAPSASNRSSAENRPSPLRVSCARNAASTVRVSGLNSKNQNFRVSGGLTGILALIGYPALDNGVPVIVSELLGDGRTYLRSVKKELRGDGLSDYSRWFRSSDDSEQIFRAGEASIAIAPYSDLSRAGVLAEANLVLCPAAIRKTAGGDEKIARRLQSISEQTRAAIVFVNAGEGESTTDGLFPGGVKIYENGALLGASPRFSDAPADAELDLGALAFRKRRAGVPSAPDPCADRITSDFVFPATVSLSRKIARFPFISTDSVAQATDIFDTQAESLRRRLSFVHADTAVVGVSGGLDSTLALLVSVEAVKRAGRSPSGVLAVTSPGDGTSGRTYRNAKKLMELLGVEQKEIPIADAVRAHLGDLGHAGDADVAYENAQARERMQILMDLANMRRGIVVGTGDLSELATGFTTYNGDHMAMYGVNASVPKTLLRSVVKTLAEQAGGELGKVLFDVVETPVSPELKPSKDGEIAQFTESVVGAYELVDFFLYHFLLNGADAEKILFLARRAFGGSYPDAEIKRCLDGFFRRFFASQFKRTCMPDGADATGFSLSPRGGFSLGADTGSEPFLNF